MCLEEEETLRKKNNQKVTLPSVVYIYIPPSYIYIYTSYIHIYIRPFTRSAFNVFTNFFRFLYFGCLLSRWKNDNSNLDRFLDLSFLHNFVTKNLLFNFNFITIQNCVYSIIEIFFRVSTFRSSFLFSFCVRRSGKINRWLMIASEENSSRVEYARDAWRTHISSALTYGSQRNQVSKLRDEDGSISRGIET